MLTETHIVNSRQENINYEIYEYFILSLFYVIDFRKSEFKFFCFNFIF